MAAGGSSSMRRDVVSAYVASAAKIGSWAIVSAMVYRDLSPTAFGVLALVRGTIGLLSYASVGLGPALMRLIAEETNRPRRAIPVEADSPTPGALSYHRAAAGHDPAYGPYTNGLTIALIAGGIGILLTWVYAGCFESFHRIGTARGDVRLLVLGIGIGTITRLVSDAPGAVLQTRGHIALDNCLLGLADILWCVLSWRWTGATGLEAVGSAFAWASLLLLTGRLLIAGRIMGGLYGWGLIDYAVLRRLLGLGGMVVLAQLADYLYAPTDYILIDALLDERSLAAYAPAVQIDGALLSLVSGLAAVLLPKSARAHAAGDARTVRQYYVRGTIVSVGLLTAAGLCVWLAGPWIFMRWFGNPMPNTQLILPLVLVHTIVGGSSAVGRSVLLGMGKVKVFTIAVLIGGVSNVIFSFVFVKYLGLGLRGIVIGTIIAVVLRCGVWMPWYVLRSLRAGSPISAGMEEPMVLRDS
jgi:O-antigen/teichoic acid export membrane protein